MPLDSVIDIEQFQSAEKMSETSADERITAAVSVFMKMIQDSSQKWNAWTKACSITTLPVSTNNSAVNWMKSSITKNFKNRIRMARFEILGRPNRLPSQCQN